MNRVVEVSHYGAADVLRLVERPVDEPGPGEVRIRHRAIGVNFTDVYQRNGVHPVKYEFPMRLGMEAAGDIEAVGEGVVHLRAGDRAVYATHPPGSYSDARILDAQNVCRLPDDIGYETAAAMMLKGLTAQYLLKQCPPLGGLNPGDLVLFHAAAGGVGLIVCQWARALGLRLIATAGSPQKCILALAMGAEHAVDYRREDFVQRVKEITAGQGVKVVYDAVGKDTFEGSLQCLRRFGLMVNFGSASGPPPKIFVPDLGTESLYVTRQSVFNFLVSREATQSMADDLFEAVSTGQVKIHPPTVYRLHEVAQAQADLEARRTTGSLILVP